MKQAIKFQVNKQAGDHTCTLQVSSQTVKR